MFLEIVVPGAVVERVALPQPMPRVPPAPAVAAAKGAVRTVRGGLGTSRSPGGGAWT